MVKVLFVGFPCLTPGDPGLQTFGEDRFSGQEQVRLCFLDQSAEEVGN